MTETQQLLLKQACWHVIRTFNRSGIVLPKDNPCGFAHKDAIEMIRLILCEIGESERKSADNQSTPDESVVAP